MVFRVITIKFVIHLTNFRLEELNKQLTTMSLDDGSLLFLKKADEVNQKIKAERAATSQVISGSKNGYGRNGSSNGLDDWTSEDLALLIKSVNIFPAGTVQR